MRYRVAAAEEDRFVAEVWSLGTVGIEIAANDGKSAEYLVYFPWPVTGEIRNLMLGWETPVGASLLESTEVVSSDWLSVYRSQVVPFAVGSRWWIDPREPSSGPVATPEGRLLLRIPARTAFGIGSHASTALMIELMDEVDLEGFRVLDVGTGTGILAMVALASQAATVLGLDTDPVATFVASSTCRLNGWSPQLLAGGLSSLLLQPSLPAFDLVMANILLSHIRPEFSTLGDCLRHGGLLLLSGLLDTQRSQVTSELKDLGFAYRNHRVQDEWAAIVLERKP